jgi:hypothetical protein
MSYRISAADAVGAIGLQRDDAAGALKKARELEASGFRNVRVIDPDGKEHGVEEFARALESSSA